MVAQLVVLGLALWAQMSVLYARQPDARAIATAAAGAVWEDVVAGRPPVGASYLEDLAVQDYWAARESGLDAHAVGDGGEAHGPWQLHGPCGGLSLPRQARCWRSLVREGVRLCPDAPYAILWGACALPLSRYGGTGTSRTASLARVRTAAYLLARILAP